MKKNRIILTLSTLAVGIALVGVANAGTINDAVRNQPANQTVPQAYMTQENLDAMYKNMGVNITGQTSPQDSQNGVDKAAANDNGNSRPATMVPQMMNGQNSVNFEKMNEVHQQNYQQMTELQKSMPGPQNGMMQSMGSGMAGQSGGRMMGR